MFSNIFFDDLGDFAYKEKKCPNCKNTLSSYRKTGMLGCMECYKIFEDEVNSYVNKIYNGDTHKGKFPSNHKGDYENISLKLKRALDNEDYIEAARLRELLRHGKG